ENSMTTAPPANTITAPPTALRRLDQAMEFVWLSAIALIPLALLPDDVMVIGAEAPKIFLLRSAAVALAVLTMTRWWLAWALAGGMSDVLGEARRLTGWTTKSQARLVGIGALAVLAVTALGTAMSPVPRVSTWGIDVGVDTTAFANTAAYLVLFGVMAARLRGRPAINRLLWTIVGSATAVALFGIGQALFGFADEGSQRIGIKSTIGNPVFVGSYFAITIPLTLGFVLAGGVRWKGLPDWTMGALVLLPQVVAVGLTGTRGSLVSLAVGLPLVVGLLAWVGGKPAARLVGLMLAPLVGVAVLGLLLGAVAPDDSDLSRIMSRYLQLPSQLDELTGSASIRTAIWERSIDVFLDPRWPDTDLYPEIPALAAESLRPLIGYGPEMFRYAYLQSDIENSAGLSLHAHSFVLHTAVELGLLGVVAYGGLVLAAAWLLLRLVRRARGGSLTWTTYIAIGLLGALASRIVEQIPGKAQVSDLALSWTLAALVVALVLLPQQDGRTPASAKPSVNKEDKELSLGHMLPLVVMLAGSIVLWWQAVLGPMVSLTKTASAIQAAGRGEIVEALEAFDSGIAWSPEVAVNYTNRTFLLVSSQAPPEEFGFSSTRNLRVAALGATVEVLNRNPLDYRAWDIRRGIIESFVRGGLVDPADLDRIDEIQAQLMRLPQR
ncbi:MAG: O-antigen ligase family protein, partial [Chloroflexi bacterium]|nr:O-antigen ligase family protein [Chloroflexota bacterium]